MAMTSNQRCDWSGTNRLYVAYHDEEWGVPLHDDQRLFEFLVLEGAQAGLSWLTILRKRPAYRKAFAGFDPEKVARFDKRKADRLLQNSGIIRNRLKVASAINNARAFLKIVDQFGSFKVYQWRFVDGLPRLNLWKSMAQLPARTAESDVMSHDLKQRGFTFVGPTICYAHMQAVGLVNDHMVSCFRHGQIGGSPWPARRRSMKYL